MMINVEVVTNNEVFLWCEAFRVLAVRRSVPLLREAGLPASLAERPGPAQVIARDCMIAGRDIQRPRGMTYIEAVVPLLQAAFDQLAYVYGEEASRTVYRWMLRSFIARELRGTLLQWCNVLPRLAYPLNIPDRFARIPSPLPAEVLGGFVAAAEPWFGPESSYKRGKELEAGAYAVPLSEEEKQLLLIRAPDRYADVVVSLSNAMAVNSAYQVWRYLSTAFTPGQQELFVDWAHEQAAASTLPTRRLVNPTALLGF